MPPKILDKDTQLSREAEVLDCALEMIDEQGVSTLTIDSLVKQVPYSKGTIYNHFSCKEDLLVALSCRELNALIELTERSANFDGNSREKCLGFQFAYMLYAKLHPTSFLVVITAFSMIIKERASQHRLKELFELENRATNNLLAIINKALDTGECTPPLPMRPEQIAFLCWSLGFGNNTLLMDELQIPMIEKGLLMEEELINNSNILLDGLNWLPLSNQHDWYSTVDRFKRELFPEELKKLASHGKALAI